MENLKNLIKKSGMTTTWYMILMTYLFLFTLIGYTTFFYNNNFSTNSESFEKIVRDYGNNDKQKLVEKLLKLDAENSQSSNTLSSQAFNVVLGAIVSFLSSTLMLRGKK
jgi:predicted PurR-regulated permease PerM